MLFTKVINNIFKLKKVNPINNPIIINIISKSIKYIE